MSKLRQLVYWPARCGIHGTRTVCDHFDKGQWNGQTTISGSTETLVDETQLRLAFRNFQPSLLGPFIILLFSCETMHCHYLTMWWRNCDIHSRRSSLVDRLSDSCLEGDVRYVTIFLNLVYIYRKPQSCLIIYHIVRHGLDGTRSDLSVR